eukprot:UN28693
MKQNNVSGKKCSPASDNLSHSGSIAKINRTIQDHEIIKLLKESKEEFNKTGEVELNQKR